MLGVDDDALNNILNEMFFLNRDNVNPKLCVGGALRPMLEWALAALIMYMPLQFSYESLSVDVQVNYWLVLVSANLYLILNACECQEHIFLCHFVQCVSS
jgi:hypothetical protein